MLSVDGQVVCSFFYRTLVFFFGPEKNYRCRKGLKARGVIKPKENTRTVVLFSSHPKPFVSQSTPPHTRKKKLQMRQGAQSWGCDSAQRKYSYCITNITVANITTASPVLQLQRTTDAARGSKLGG